MPVLLARLDEHDVAESDFLHAGVGGKNTDAVGDVEGLALNWRCQAMRALEDNRTWHERKAPDTHRAADPPAHTQSSQLPAA